MRRSKFAEEQIFATLREQGAGISLLDLRLKHSISSFTFDAGQAKLGRKYVSESKRMDANAEENAKRKRSVADTRLNNVAMKYPQKTNLTPAARPSVIVQTTPASQRASSRRAKLSGWIAG